MFLTFALAFVGGSIGAFAGVIGAHGFLVHKGLIPEKTGGILSQAGPRIFKRQEKRVPKVNTDLKAYQSEQKELGENRG